MPLLDVTALDQDTKREQCAIKEKQDPWGTFQKLLSGFCPLKGYPPPPLTPVTENYFAKKPLTERGGTPPPP